MTAICSGRALARQGRPVPKTRMRQWAGSSAIRRRSLFRFLPEAGDPSPQGDDGGGVAMSFAVGQDSACELELATTGYVRSRYRWGHGKFGWESVRADPGVLRQGGAGALVGHGLCDRSLGRVRLQRGDAARKNAARRRCSAHKRTVRAAATRPPRWLIRHALLGVADTFANNHFGCGAHAMATRRRAAPLVRNSLRVPRRAKPTFARRAVRDSFRPARGRAQNT